MPTTDAQKKAIQKYQKEKVDHLSVRVEKGKAQYYRDAADKAGTSFNKFAVSAMDEKIDRDGLRDKKLIKKN